MLESTGANLVFPPGDLDALKAALLSAIKDLPKLDEHALLNRQLVLDNFSRDGGGSA